MLLKIKKKPLWYQVWAVSVAIGAIYVLLKYFLSELTALDRLINVYALVSIFLDTLFFSSKNNEQFK